MWGVGRGDEAWTCAVSWKVLLWKVLWNIIWHDRGYCNSISSERWWNCHKSVCMLFSLLICCSFITLKGNIFISWWLGWAVTLPNAEGAVISRRQPWNSTLHTELNSRLIYILLIWKYENSGTLLSPCISLFGKHIHFMYDHLAFNWYKPWKCQERMFQSRQQECQLSL